MWPFNKEEKAGEILEDEQASDGKVIAHVEVKRHDRHTKSVKAVVVLCATSDTVFKTTFESDKSDFATYNLASDLIKQFNREHDYVIQGDITTTGADLPTVQTVPNKRTR
ncbi:hypothetical protein [Alkalibacillus almallahensis]|uniref:hypothetical protein n=1 Tax=Alkalibacillus almallahensis TaxID=1379154 RepID=UPI001421E575|nr:hypothetical protein [Alkalibacillus almallahensis]NIK13136.1 hypothetical protein [Alkalibacillus almallahensis]